MRLLGDRLTATGAGVPVPVRLTVCEPPVALSLMLSVPVRVPVAVGLNVTLIVQLLGAVGLPAGRLEPQLLLCAKSPVALMPLMFKTPAPVLLRVTVCAVLVVPTFWEVNVKLLPERLATGVTPVPAKLITWNAPEASSATVT